MRLLALVPLRSIERVRDVAGVGAYVRAANTPEIALTQLRSGLDWDIVLIDPDLLSGHECDQVVRDAEECQVSLILYSRMVGATPLAALVMSAAGVILEGREDEVPALKELFDDLPARPLEFRLLQRLAGQLDALPTATRRAVFSLFSPHRQIQSTKLMVAASGISRRALDRWMTRIGFRSAKGLVAAARLARAITSFRNANTSLRDVALVHGYGSVRTLTAQSLSLTGLGPRSVAMHLTDNEILARLEASVLAAEKP